MLTGWQWVFLAFTCLGATTGMAFAHILPGEVPATLAGTIVGLFAKIAVKETP